MGSRLVALMLTIPMLLHGVFGCSWHHDHASCQATAEHAVARCDHDHESELSHSDAPTIPDGMGGGSHEHESCSQLRCDFVGSGVTRVAAESSTAACWNPTTSITTSSTVAMIAQSMAMPAGDELCASLRAHARCQVWLI